MNENKNKQVQSALISESARSSAQAYEKENLKMRRRMEDDFFQKSFDFRDYIFSPQGYEGLVLTLYIMAIPYAMGLLFLFLFVARASYEYFLQFNISSFFIIWAIGYEVCAALILIGILVAWIMHIHERWNREQSQRKSPKKYGI
ncbi:hypothetical protein [Sulfuricurvum sp.]|uniref:hypothetical protein n=1 Tax=Sulfuricurvum sp. TaxID=2025608 RepID=UPI003BB71718